ncbi:MAG: sensor histidine kinase [Bacillota bacterium]|nr:sensor histidine kinase [Bacillota bacterium]MDP4169781.1 sensor histidine kinase [Bacillota bacterium]
MGLLSANQPISSYIIQTQEEEIKRIALELHEGVGQNLYSLYTGLQFIEAGTGQPQLKSYIQEMARLMERTIQEIRLLSVELHPPSLSSLGLLPAIKSYTKLFTSTFGILVEIESKGDERPIAEQSNIAVFRVCQEALANAAKYADTSRISLQFSWDQAEVNIVLKDFGKGFDYDESSPSQSSGLAAMKERMLLAGGTCAISSKIGEGTTIEISLPLRGDSGDQRRAIVDKNSAC